MKVPKILIVAVVFSLISAAAFFLPRYGGVAPKPVIIDFNTCKFAGGIILETYPAQCQFGEQRFTQNIGNQLELKDVILISNPVPNQKITSPLKISGMAKGSWYFEASFPIKLVDDKGNKIAESHAQAKGDWMTDNFVPFESTLEFKTNSKRGTLILQKDNPSGLPKNDKQLEVPITFN